MATAGNVGAMVRWYRRLGLQRRIMAYVAVGVAIMFATAAYLGLLAIREATELVFQERLGTASAMATILDHNLQEIVHDVDTLHLRLLRGDSPAELRMAGDDLFEQISTRTSFPLVAARQVVLVDWDSGAQHWFPGAGVAQRDLPPLDTLRAVREPALLPPPGAADDPLFGILVVPMERPDRPGWLAVVYLMGLNEDASFVPFPATPAEEDPEAAPSGQNRVEVLSPGGVVTLRRGSRTAPGGVSPHWRLLNRDHTDHTGASAPFVFLHSPARGQDFPAHVVAAVPLGSGQYTVVLEQSADVALALPTRLRQRLVYFAAIGFLATMLLAWVTTRHVVKPTEVLTRAAQRIAAGQVDSPIVVAAQDEIGTLAESLETMRRRLQAWTSDMETEVNARTRELQKRNQELGVLYDKLNRSQVQLRSLLEKVLGAQEEERKRVSRELHDGVGQSMSALYMELERLESIGPNHWPSVEAGIGKLKELTNSILSELRRVTVALRPAALDDLGLVPAIRRYAELRLGDASVAFQVQSDGLPTRLEPDVETVVYRVVQEAINNVAQHSKATYATVLLRATGDILSATVEDNGCGFDPQRLASDGGLGIEGMKERASLVDGRLTVDSQPSQGTLVRLVIPLEGIAGDKRHGEVDGVASR